MDLDIKDIKILSELDKNARISCAQVGKKIGLSSEVVNYRIKKLEERGIIAKYQTVVNYSKLGLILFKMCFKFNGLSLENEEKLYKKLAEIKETIWIAKCQGDWDCMVSCTVEDYLEIDPVKDKIINIASDYISDKTLSFSSKVWSFTRGYLSKEPHKKFEMVSGEKLKLDKTDIKILRLLAEDSRIPIVNLAKQTNTTVKIITTRLRRLVKEKALSYRILLDYEKADINFFKVLIYLKDTEKQRVESLLKNLHSNPHIIFNLKVVGEWELEPEFEFEDEHDFKKFTQQLLNNYSDIIKRISIIDVIKEYKYPLFSK